MTLAAGEAEVVRALSISRTSPAPSHSTGWFMCPSGMGSAGTLHLSEDGISGVLYRFRVFKCWECHDVNLACQLDYIRS